MTDGNNFFSNLVDETYQILEQELFHRKESDRSQGFIQWTESGGRVPIEYYASKNFFRLFMDKDHFFDIPSNYGPFDLVSNSLLRSKKCVFYTWGCPQLDFVRGLVDFQKHKIAGMVLIYNGKKTALYLVNEKKLKNIIRITTRNPVSGYEQAA